MAPVLKTYSHLAGRRRVPSEYELVTSGLLYYPGKGFEVEVPLSAWYRQQQQGSPLVCADWERFADPRETTYTSYVALQAAQESHVAGLLRSIDASDYDLSLSEPGRKLLARGVTPLRFAFHGLQMIAAYVGQMAPSGRIAVAALFQAADEARRLQRIAYRMAQLRRAHCGFADDSRALWQEHSAWQPLRRLIERLLVTYDWGEALVALNLCAKPILDRFTMAELAAEARRAGDYLLGEIFFSLAEDCRWHAAWTQALIAMVLADGPHNREVIEGWIRAWLPQARDAAAGLATLFEDPDRGAGAVTAAEEHAARFRGSLGLTGVPGEAHA
jgi:toluene monooxygenase system protein E